MESFPTYFDPQTLAKLATLRLRARHIVEGYVAGLHRSPYRGHSIEFAEHREYSPGDDLRYVDWKVFGRTDKIYLKQFEDETNLLCYLVIDGSESMLYQADDSPLSKLEYAKCAAASLAWLVLQQQDAVGLTVFDHEVRTSLRPSSHAAVLKDLLQTLEGVEPGKKTAAGPIFHDLAKRLVKRGVVMILSDFFDDAASITAGLKHFRHRRHDVIVFHVLDRAEMEFPFRQPTMFDGLETAPDVLADPRSLRRSYLEEFADYRRRLEHACRSLQIDYCLLRTDQPLDFVLSKYLANRKAKTR